jgi:methyl-accepting chemotaxis protein
MYAGLTGISFLVLFGVIFWSTTRFMRHQIDDSVSSELDEITTDSQAGNADGMASIVQGLAKHSSGFYYLLQDPAGMVRAGNLPAVSPLMGIREWGESPRSPYSALRGRGINILGNYLFVGWSTHQLHEMEEMVVSSFVWGLATSIALALAGGIVTSGRLLRKIEVISETSRNIIEGDLQRRVPVTRTGDEFDHLADSINTMLDRIQALMEDLRQVTTDIAHDMRTPLTRLRQRLEIAQQSPADAAQNGESSRRPLVRSMSFSRFLVRCFELPKLKVARARLHLPACISATCCTRPSNSTARRPTRSINCSRRRSTQV